MRRFWPLPRRVAAFVLERGESEEDEEDEEDEESGDREIPAKTPMDR
jgi:hypothetical protein